MGVSPEPQPKSPISIKHGALVRKRLTRRIKSNPQVSTSRQLTPLTSNSRASTRFKSCIIKSTDWNAELYSAGGELASLPLGPPLNHQLTLSSK